MAVVSAALLLAIAWTAHHDFHAAACRPMSFAMLNNFDLDEKTVTTAISPCPSASSTANASALKVS